MVDGFRAPVGSLDGPREITYANGSVLAISRALFEDLGGFTDELFTYHEDLELGWRARMRGLRIVLDPGGDVSTTTTTGGTRPRTTSWSETG